MSRVREHEYLLVVDDERSVREVLAESLEIFGYRVRAASSAKEAMALVREGGIHLVLSDIDMPEENGIELLRRIKAHDEDVDVIMVTGVMDVDIAIGSIRDGASDYVTKPFNLEQVKIAVKRVLDRRNLILENRAYQQRLEDMVAERTQELVEKRQQVEQLYSELEESYESTLQALVTALDYRDNETQGHSWRVVEYATVVAKLMGIEGPELAWLRRGALLHDVGKIGIPDAILRKPDKLDPREVREMQRHPEIGYRMLQDIGFLKPSLDVVLSHQERWDGQGYPNGLRGKQIPVASRIFAVVDTFDAMTSDRPYRSALTIAEAKEEVKLCTGTQFDPEVAEVFLSVDEEVWREIRARADREVDDLSERVRRVLS